MNLGDTASAFWLKDGSEALQSVPAVRVGADAFGEEEAGVKLT